MKRPSFALSIPQRVRNAGHDCSRIDRQVRHLNQRDLAGRWNMSVRTLERWRWQRRGPKFIKLGGRVLYRLVDIEKYETQHEHAGVDRPGADR